MGKVVLVDYGVGNIGNLKNAFEKMGIDAELTDNAQTILGSDLAVLPGVGAFGEAMEKLRSKGLDSVILQRAQNNRAVLGICLGMQMLCEGSEEYGTEQRGLGWIGGTLRSFEPGIRVPHMGWNTLRFTKDCKNCSEQDEQGPYVYFVHSFKLSDFKAEEVVAFSDYYGPVPAIVQRGSVTGFQFHPEKSGAYGRSLLLSYVQRLGLVSMKADFQ